MKYQILYTINGQTCVCCEKDSKGKAWGFTHTEEQAQNRVASLAEVGITATYEPIDESHWVNNWIGYYGRLYRPPYNKGDYIMALTKSAMLDYIEKTGMVIDFDRKYLMSKTRAYIAELYSRANVYARNLSDWGGVIGKLLKNAERKADAMGYDIDNDQEWQNIHTVLVEWDMGERTLTAEDKQYIALHTELIYRKLNLDMWGTALRYIEETWSK